MVYTGCCILNGLRFDTQIEMRKVRGNRQHWENHFNNSISLKSFSSNSFIFSSYSSISFSFSFNSLSIYTSWWKMTTVCEIRWAMIFQKYDVFYFGVCIFSSLLYFSLSLFSACIFKNARMNKLRHYLCDAFSVSILCCFVLFFYLSFSFYPLHVLRVCASWGLRHHKL